MGNAEENDESRLNEKRFILEQIEAALNGEPVHADAKDYPVIAQVQALYTESKIRSGVVVDLSKNGEYTVATVSIDGSLEGTGTSRQEKNAVSYALEDLAQKVKLS